MTDREALDMIDRAYRAGFALHRKGEYYWSGAHGQEIEGARARTLNEVIELGHTVLGELPRYVNYYTIQSEDIGRRDIVAFGKTWSVRDLMGHVKGRDIGKRVYRSRTPGGRFVLQVENDEQFAARLAVSV